MFKSKDGTVDTVYNFNQKAPEEGSDNVVAIKLHPTSDVADDTEWETATTSKWDSNPVRKGLITQKNGSDLHVVASRGIIRVFCHSEKEMSGMISLSDLQGRIIFSHKVKNISGKNEFTIPANYSGPVIVQINQGSSVLVSKVLSIY